MRNKTIILFLALSVYAHIAHAEDAHQKSCKVQQLGWHFYCDPEKEEDVPEEKKVKDPKDKTPEDYIAERDAVRKEIEWKLSRAVLYPTADNIQSYIQAQKEKVMEPSTEFTQKWQKTIWTNPNLDYTLKHPVNTIGKQAWMDDTNKSKINTMTHLNDTYGVFFFYSSTCPYCQKFAPILKEFANKHSITVMAVTMDGVSLPDWPDSVTDHGQAEKMGVRGKPVPATILFNKKTKEIVPIGYGLMAMDELEMRIFAMTENGAADAQ